MWRVQGLTRSASGMDRSHHHRRCRPRMLLAVFRLDDQAGRLEPVADRGDHVLADAELDRRVFGLEDRITAYHRACVPW